MKVSTKPGVRFTTIAPAGFRLLGAIERAARVVGVPLVITSACDGTHSGPADPHLVGEAYDLRTRTLTPAQADAVLLAILGWCRDDPDPPPAPVEGVPRSLATRNFFGFVEASGSMNEHIHVQRRKGRVY